MGSAADTDNGNNNNSNNNNNNNKNKNKNNDSNREVNSEEGGEWRLDTARRLGGVSSIISKYLLYLQH